MLEPLTNSLQLNKKPIEMLKKSGKKPFKNCENQRKRRKLMKNPIKKVEKLSKIQSKA